MSRNVVLVTYDSLRADHCGFMGYERDTTPTLDRLAHDGVVFENAVASGVPTIASMTAVMTGNYSLASPEIGFDEAQCKQVTQRPTIAEVVSEAGYATGGLSPNPPASSYFGFDEGFDWFEDFLAADRGVLERAWNRVFERSIAGGSATRYLRLARNVVRREEVLRPWEDYYDHITEWREAVEEPYFLWILVLEPHHPWVPPSSSQRWSSRWDKYRSFRHYWEMLNSGWEPEFDGTVRERMIDLYDDSIRHGDSFLEQLWTDLQADEPVFIVHSDHGEEFSENGRYGHQPDVTEELIHVPLVVWGLEESWRVETPVGLRELAPTIAELTGSPCPFAGRDLLSLDDDTRPWVVSKVFVGGKRRAAVRTATHEFRRRNGRTELVDVTSGSCESIGNESAAAFATALDRHVAAEREKEAVRSGGERLIVEGRV